MTTSTAVNDAEVSNDQETAKSLAWLHCNECHRGFEHHNRLHQYNANQQSDSTHSIRIVKSDLRFGFTSCGHFFCEQCFKMHSANGQFVCPFCKEPAAEYRLDGVVPKKLEMYMRAPLGLLEDALSVMMFQISNANQLILSLRGKISQQKELLGKAKQELASKQAMKARIEELEAEVARLQKADPSSFQPAQRMLQQSPVIMKTARMPLRSPVLGSSGIFSRTKAASPMISDRPQMDFMMNQPVMYQQQPLQPFQQNEYSPRTSFAGSLQSHGWISEQPQMHRAPPPGYYQPPSGYPFGSDITPRPVLRRRPQ